MTDPTQVIPRWRFRDHLPSLVIVGIGFAITLGVVLYSRAEAQRAEIASLDRRSGTLTQALRVSLDLWLEVLLQVGTFFESSSDVTRADFHDFAAPPRQRYPEIAALEWFPLVNGADRAALEAKVRAEGMPGFVFRELGPAGGLVEAAPRAGYLPMLYTEPTNPALIGLDLFSESTRRRPAEQARDRGAPVASARIVLVEDPPDIYSVTIYHPVYRHGVDLSSEAARRQAFTGVVGEVLRIGPIITRALHGIDLNGATVTLLDQSADSGERILWTSQAEVLQGARQQLRDFEFAGRKWALAFAAPSGGTFGSQLPWAMLVIGLGVSLTLGGILSVARTILRLRRAVMRARTIGAYRLLSKINEGGMGVVYKARHAMLRRPTALKILAPGRGGEAELRRFEREVQLTSRLTHPNTIVIFDYGRTHDDTFYYAMEYLDGITLETLIREHGPQAPRRIVRIMDQVCGALAEAHSIGLIHRDVKPANIMLCHRGGIPDVVKVLDFGLVKEMNVDTGVSEAGTSYGTPLYLAPENISHPNTIDHRVDLYAVGLVMYYLCSGQRAVVGTNIAEVLHQHLELSPERPSHWLGRQLPEAFESLIMTCLEKDPARRPQTASDLRQRLLGISDLGPWSPWSIEDAEAFWAVERAKQPQQGPQSEMELTIDIDRRN